jgi:hypothetical protein
MEIVLLVKYINQITPISPKNGHNMITNAMESDSSKATKSINVRATARTAARPN